MRPGYMPAETAHVPDMPARNPKPSPPRGRARGLDQRERGNQRGAGAHAAHDDGNHDPHPGLARPGGRARRRRRRLARAHEAHAQRPAARARLHQCAQARREARRRVAGEARRRRVAVRVRGLVRGRVRVGGCAGGAVCGGWRRAGRGDGAGALPANGRCSTTRNRHHMTASGAASVRRRRRGRGPWQARRRLYLRGARRSPPKLERRRPRWPLQSARCQAAFVGHKPACGTSRASSFAAWAFSDAWVLGALWAIWPPAEDVMARNHHIPNQIDSLGRDERGSRPRSPRQSLSTRLMSAGPLGTSCSAAG